MRIGIGVLLNAPPLQQPSVCCALQCSQDSVFACRHAAALACGSGHYPKLACHFLFLSLAVHSLANCFFPEARFSQICRLSRDALGFRRILRAHVYNKLTILLLCCCIQKRVVAKTIFCLITIVVASMSCLSSKLVYLR